MIALAAGWLGGTLALQASAGLPRPGVVIAWIIGGSIVLLCVPLVRRWRWLPLLLLTLAGIALGAGTTAWRAELRLTEALPAALEGRDLALTGIVSGLPDAMPNGRRFRFEVERATLAGEPVTLPQQLALGWYAHDSRLPDLQPGERWALNVRLKRPHGLANPGGFDVEAWWLTEGVRATGYVRGEGARRVEPFVFSVRDSIGRARAWLRTRIEAALPDARYAGVIVALVVGEQRAIAQSDWDIFNRTGIAHLVSISGLHITMIAALVAGIVHFLWRHSGFTGGSWPLRLPAPKLAAACGLLAALVYVALAGFGIPAQRTLLMLAVITLALWCARLVPAPQVLAAALLAVLLLDPWAVLWPGFWLSFFAVACLMAAAEGRVQHEGAAGVIGALQAGVKTQWVVTVALLPLTLLLFAQVSLVSPLANAIAIPLVSFVVTPLALLGSVLPAPLHGWLLGAAHAAMQMLAQLLEWLAQWPLAVWQVPAPEWPAAAVALAGTLWLLAPRGWPWRWVGALAWLPLLSAAPSAPDSGIRVTAFDVGQGNAVLVETRHFRLLYDTGPAYSSETDGGSRVILPYLRARGIHRLDGLVISHSDIDHSGGARSLAAAIDIGWVSSSLPPTHPLLSEVAPGRHAPCIAGQRWVWDGVEFAVLHPLAGDASTKPNARSCVLRISAGGRVLLLGGDIEAAQERALLARVPESLRADVLLAPHHGSGTSSTSAFLDAVAPRLALFQLGYRNRYRHPKGEVVERYRARGIRMLRSDRSGAVTLQINAGGISVQQACETPRYWSTRRCINKGMLFAHDRPP